MSYRKSTGAVAGGNAARNLPLGLEVGNWPGHAADRLDAMAEILVNAMFLKMKGFAKAVTSFEGADYQDFTGSNDEAVHRVAAAHRAMFALYMDGVNMSSLPTVRNKETLVEYLIAPQARTDGIIAAANYADSLLEKAANADVYVIINAAVSLQMPDAAFKAEEAIAAMHRIKHIIEKGMGQALADFERRRLDESMEAEAKSGFSMSSVTGQEIDALLSNIREGGMSMYRSNRPTRYYDLVVTALSIGRQLTGAATARLAVRNTLMGYLAELEEAAK
jgi:hypothetical protein